MDVPLPKGNRKTWAGDAKEGKSAGRSVGEPSADIVTLSQQSKLGDSSCFTYWRKKCYITQTPQYYLLTFKTKAGSITYCNDPGMFIDCQRFPIRAAYAKSLRSLGENNQFKHFDGIALEQRVSDWRAGHNIIGDLKKATPSGCVSWRGSSDGYGIKVPKA